MLTKHYILLNWSLKTQSTSPTLHRIGLILFRENKPQTYLSPSFNLKWHQAVKGSSEIFFDYKTRRYSHFQFSN